MEFGYLDMELIYEMSEDDIDLFFAMSNKDIPLTNKGLFNMSYMTKEEKRVFKIFLEKRKEYSSRAIKNY